MFFKLIEETSREVLLLREFANELINFCKDEGIDFELDDKLNKCKEVVFSAKIVLYNYQKRVIESIAHKAFGAILVDECHHIPARTFREAITHFSSYYLRNTKTKEQR